MSIINSFTTAFNVFNVMKNMKDNDMEEQNENNGLLKEDVDYDNLLKNNVIEVTFIKRNGDERVMKCTRDMKFIPEESWPSNSKSHRKTPEYQVCVWDLDKSAWRSFDKLMVTSVKVL